MGDLQRSSSRGTGLSFSSVKPENVIGAGAERERKKRDKFCWHFIGHSLQLLQTLLTCENYPTIPILHYFSSQFIRWCSPPDCSVKHPPRKHGDLNLTEPQSPCKKGSVCWHTAQSQCWKHWPPKKAIPKEWHLRFTTGSTMFAQTNERAPPCVDICTCRSTHRASVIYLFLYCLLNLLFI